VGKIYNYYTKKRWILSWTATKSVPKKIFNVLHDGRDKDFYNHNKNAEWTGRGYVLIGAKINSKDILMSWGCAVKYLKALKALDKTSQ